MNVITLNYPDWADRYLTALRRTGLEATARGIAQVSKQMVVRLEADDVEFSEAIADAKDKWADRLEVEAYRRGVKGIEKGIYYQGDLVATELQYSDALLTTLLKAKRQSEFGDKKQITGAGGAPLTVHIRTFAPPSSDYSATHTRGDLPIVEGDFIPLILDEISADDLA